MLYQAGTGTLSLTGSSTFSSAIVINQGAVSISNIAALGTAQPLGEYSSVIFTGASSTAPGVLLYLGGTATLSENLTVDSHDYGLVDNAGNGVLTLSGTISKNGSVMTLAGGRFVVGGTIAGSSAGSDLVIGSTQYGAATVGLTTANFYNGPTVITNGSTLLTGVNGALPSATPSAIILGAPNDYQINTLDLLGTKQTVASLTSMGSGPNQIISSNGAAGPNPGISFTPSKATGSLAVNYSGSTTDTFTGFLGGVYAFGSANNFGLILGGTGTVALTRANPYSGGTTVSLGALLLQNGSNGSATGSGALSVASGATIGGAGTSRSTYFIINGNVLVGNGTDVTSQTTLVGTTASSFAGANFTFNLGTGANQGHSNLLNLGATPISFADTTFTFNLVGSDAIQPGSSFTLITTSGPINASTDGLTLGANGQIIGGLSIAGTSLFGTSENGYTSGFYGGSFLYISGDNIDVEVVPEPSSWALVLAGLGVLAVLRVRRARLA
jgi:autotransporter-associated beta strand protein